MAAVKKRILTRTNIFYKKVGMKADGFRWNEWNLENATKHGCTVKEIEAIVRR